MLGDYGFGFLLCVLCHFVFSSQTCVTLGHMDLGRANDVVSVLTDYF